jgi:CTP:molybdopterin cytidylyltransferase MocA
VAARQDLAAIVLAAGFSRRMGAFKPLLPFSSTTVIERVIAIIHEAGVEAIRVVVGWQAEQLIPVLARCEIPWVRNERVEDGMFSSVQAGVRSLPSGLRAFFVLPGDMPLVHPITLTRLMAAWDVQPGGIVYPCYQGRRGHPPLIRAACIPEILAETPSGSLRDLLARHAQDAHELEVTDAGILLDLDTPEAYRASLRGDPPA